MSVSGTDTDVSEAGDEKSHPGSMPLGVGVAGLALYALLLVVMLVSFAWTCVAARWQRRRGQPCGAPASAEQRPFLSPPPPRRADGRIGTVASAVRNTFRSFLTAAVVVRLVWFGLYLFTPDARETEDAAFLLNRVVLVLLFTAFTLVVFFWAETYYRTYCETSEFLPQLGGVFVALNIVVYVFHIAAAALFFALPDQRYAGNPVYEANILLDVSMFTLTALGFLVYGSLLFLRTRRDAEGPTVEPSQLRELARIVLLTVVFSICFLLRAFFFSFRLIAELITGHAYYFSAGLFYALGYFVPELVPSVLQLYLSERGQAKDTRDSSFIHSLYNGHESPPPAEQHAGEEVGVVGTGVEAGPPSPPHQPSPFSPRAASLFPHTAGAAVGQGVIQ